MSDQLPVVGGSGGAVVPAAGELAIAAGAGGDLTRHQGDARAVAHADAGRGAPPSSAQAEAVGTVLNELAVALRLSEGELNTYRAWMAQNRGRLEEAFDAWAAEEQTAIDKAECDECTRILRAEWGGSFDANIARIKAWLSAQPAALSEHILEGRRLGSWSCNDPNLVRALLQMASSSAPPGRSDAEVEQRIAEIHKLMANPSSEYWKGANSEKLQAEYRELVHLQQQRRS